MIIDEFSITDTGGLRPARFTEEKKADLEVLRTLLLVSKDVATRARHHLFESVNISFIAGEDAEGATVLVKKQLSVFANIISSSATSRDLGILPHIRRIYLYCYWRPIKWKSHRAESDSESDDDGELTSTSTVDETSLRESNPAAEYWEQLCTILNSIHDKANRIEEFFLSANNPEAYSTQASTYKVAQYRNWYGFPPNLRRSIFQCIRSPRFKLEALTVREFINLPPDLLMKTDIRFAILHTIPSTSRVLSNETDFVAPPMIWLETVDYILHKVTSLCFGSDHEESLSNDTVEVLELIIPAKRLKLPHTDDRDRFRVAGETITSFYSSLRQLYLEITGSMLFLYISFL